MTSKSDLENTTRGVFSYDLIPLRLELPEIRLLELFPAPNFTDDVWCRLYTVLIEEPPQYAGDGLPCPSCSRHGPLWYIKLPRKYGRDACQGCGLTKGSGRKFETPPYNALSYAWGDCTKSHEIFTIKPTDPKDHGCGINVASHGSESLSIPITVSLDSCLRHLRSSCGSTSLTIWIDQICIDQTNDMEKSAQVELMRKIYTMAQKVIVWLGPAADGSDDVMDAHTHAAMVWREHLQTTVAYPLSMEELAGTNDTEILGTYLSTDENWWLPCFQRIIDEVVMIYAPLIRAHKIQKWLGRVWFSRIWIIQELSLARDAVFVCGYKSVDIAHVWGPSRLLLDIFWRWAHLCLVDKLKFSETSSGILQSFPMATLEEIFHSFSVISTALEWKNCQLDWYGGETMTLLRVLIRLYANPRCASTSSRYRDRVYGLLGVASDAQVLNIRPDYSNNTKTTMILTQIARTLIQNGHEPLEVLGWAQFPKRGVTEMEDGVDEHFPLPSWVPDWHNGLLSPYRAHHGQELRSFSASLNTSLQVVPAVLQSTLGLRGFFVDTIEEVGTYIPQQKEGEPAAAKDDQNIDRAADFHGPLCAIKEFWRRSVEKNHAIYTSASRQNEALWRVPIRDLWLWSKKEDCRHVAVRPPSELGVYFQQAHEYCRIRMLIRQQRMQHATPDVEFTPILSQAEADLVQQAQDRAGVVFEYGSHLAETLRGTGLRPYLTKKGYLGLAPSHTQPGDVLVIFSGGLVPYVIRPVTTDTDRYRFKPDAGSQDKSDDQRRVNSTTEEAKQDVEDCHDPNFKLPKSPLYTEAEIHAMYEQYKFHQSTCTPPEPVVLPMRPDENDSIYTFVGEAFCDGIMDGEFMERAGEIHDFFLI